MTTTFTTRLQLLLGVAVVVGLTGGTIGQTTSVTPSQTVTPSGTTTVINDGAGHQTDPHISGSLVSYTSETFQISFVLGDGTGRFGPPTNVSLGNRNPFRCALGDLNGDGFADLVSANVGNDDVSALLWDPTTGSFGTQRNFAVGSGSFGVALGDLDGDDRLDVVTANVNSDDVSVRFGDGAGGFGQLLTFAVATGSGPWSVALGDLDGDGMLDAVVTNLKSQTISVLLGHVSLGLRAPTSFTVGQGPGAVALGHINGDAFLDAVVTHSQSGNISLLLGDGMGGFGAVSNITVGANPTAVVLEDLNEDGAVDAIVANAQSNTVYVLLGNGTGGFKPAVNLPVGDGPASVAIGDLDNDELRDVVVANAGSNDLSIHRQVTPQLLAQRPAALDAATSSRASQASVDALAAKILPVDLSLLDVGVSTRASQTALTQFASDLDADLSSVDTKVATRASEAAESALTRGNQEMEAGNYKKAYDAYAKAYQAVVK